MKKVCLFCSCILIVNLSFAQNIWINEFHYDNSGSDTNESVEIAGESGVDLNGYSLVFYNGSNGKPYKTYSIQSLTIPDQDNGYGSACFLISGIQNGSPDGIALVDPNGEVLQFLSYEGQFTATSGPASSMTSIDVGIEESPDTTIGHSLQLIGNGNSYQDFQWTLSSSSCGEINDNQTFSSGEENPTLCSPHSIHSFIQGRRKNGRRIGPRRSNPENALGDPQENDWFNFVSLGFGGTIVFELHEPLLDDGTYKPDFILVETSFGKANKMCYQDSWNRYPETVAIMVSEDAQNWYSLPDSYCRTSFIDLYEAFNKGLKAVNYIKITDISNKGLFRGNADGFDIDGLILCRNELDLALETLTNNRTRSKSLFDPEFFNHAPDEDGDFEITLSPNPVYDGRIRVRFDLSSLESLNSTLQIVDLQGRIIEEVIEKVKPGINYIERDLDLAPGQYLVKLSIGLFSDSQMIIIR